jgi:transposase
MKGVVNLNELREKEFLNIMGKQRRLKETRKKAHVIEITLEDLEGLLNRLEQKALIDPDYPLLIEIIKNLSVIEERFKNNENTIKKLQNLLFGPKTERQLLPPELKASGTGAPPKGHGKRPVDEWVDEPAKICFHAHETLSEGQLCPKCGKGKLYRFKTSVRIRVVANRPLDIERHEVERLRCSACGWVYTAVLNEDLRTYPDATPEAMAMSVLLRYESGFPIYRIVAFLSAQGVFLTWTRIWGMIEAAFEAALRIFEVLWEMAANGTLVQNDDTKMRIIDLIKKNKTKPKGERKAIQTTGLVVQLANGHKVMLFKTGHKNAGENLEDILSARTETIPPMQMADALAANRPGNHKTFLGACVDHFRRGFYDLYDDWTVEVELILGLLRKVYKIEARAKRWKLTPAHRLLLHQRRSKPHMDALYEWMQRQIREKLVEPNSNLGKEIQYGINHWEKLTAFLRFEGMPISNIAVERLLKKAVLHRKNSLSYKTERGALIGDVLMSLIFTAIEAKENAYRYFTELIKHKQDVKEQPEQWLPWNYLQRLAQLKPAHP